MREIKFRVWDGIDYMSNQFTLEDLQLGIVKFTSECNVMQYTGLKDKNGKEIYEGDIVRLPIGVEVPIVFKNGSFCVHGYHWENELCEVIGNIHENQELINNK